MRAWEKTLARMVALAKDPDSGWKVVPGQVGATVRHNKTQVTPDWAKERRGSSLPLWSDETYEVLTFVTLVAGKIILGTAAAPWVGRQDSDIPFWLADAILEDPALAHDTTRSLAMKAERKGPGRGIRRH